MMQVSFFFLLMPFQHEGPFIYPLFSATFTTPTPHLPTLSGARPARGRRGTRCEGGGEGDGVYSSAAPSATFTTPTPHLPTLSVPPPSRSQMSNRFVVFEEDDAPTTVAAPKVVKTEAPKTTATGKPVNKKDVAHKAAVMKKRADNAAPRGERPPRTERAERGERSERPPKREFDRHVSGTGRGRQIKKGGEGKFNWGNPAKEGDAEAPKEGEAAPAEAAVEAPVEPAEPEGPVVKGLAEFRAEQAAAAVAGDKKAPRQISTNFVVPKEEAPAAKAAAPAKKAAPAKGKTVINIDVFNATTKPVSSGASSEKKPQGGRKLTKNDFPAL